MSKIICDVCGTSYPETATQCPICGCVRPAETVTVNTENVTEESTTTGTYTYVKGGRFSKANVKKRNSAKVVVDEDPDFQEETVEDGGKKNDKGLTIAICVLLLAIVAVVIYIVLHFFAPGFGKGNPANTVDNNNAATTTEAATDDTTELVIPCDGIIISNTHIELDKLGAAHLLNVTTEPDNTTEEVLFESSDESVATVTAGGKVVAVGPGEAVITVMCGAAEAQCNVRCTFELPPEETTEATVDSTEATAPETTTQTFKLNWNFTMPEQPEVGDISLKVKETWSLYLGGEGMPKASEIKFTSNKSDVVTVDANGKITAVSKGEAYITAEYNGYTVKCRVLVN